MRSTATRTVAVPIDGVWSVLTDHEGMAGWAPGIKANLAKAGAAERNGVGAVRQISSPLPVPAIVEEVVEFDAPHRFAYRAVAGIPLKNYGGDVELSSPRVGSTTIRYSISADAVPVLGGVVTRAIAQTLLTALVRQVRKSA